MAGHDAQKCPFALDFGPAQQSTGDNSSLKDFASLKIIGKGTYGRVYRGIRLADNIEYAIKEIPLSSMNSKERQESLNEVRVLASLEPHMATIRYFDAFVENDKLYIVTELAKGGDLAAKIKRHLDRKERMDEDLIWTFFIQICQGLQAIHSSKIIHRDIKSANIYLVSGKRVKIGDFGVSKVLKSGMAATQIGTPYYMSPEVWQNQRYNDKSDLWALGVVLFEMAALRHPFNATTEPALRDRVLRGTFDPLPSTYSPALREVVKLLLTPEPRARPSAAQLLAHPAVAPRVAAAGLNALAPDAGPPAPRPALLETIKVPPRCTGLQLRRRLPGPMYDSTPAGPAPAPLAPQPSAAPSARGGDAGGMLPGLVPPLPTAGLPRPAPSGRGGCFPPLPTAGSDKMSDVSSGMLPAVRGKLSSCLPDNRHSMPDYRAFEPKGPAAAAAAAAEKRMAAAAAYRRGRRGLDCELYTPPPDRLG